MAEPAGRLSRAKLKVDRCKSKVCQPRFRLGERVVFFAASPLNPCEESAGGQAAALQVVFVLLDRDCKAESG